MKPVNYETEEEKKAKEDFLKRLNAGRSRPREKRSMAVVKYSIEKGKVVTILIG